jgi:hypothetical protein
LGSFCIFLGGKPRKIFVFFGGGFVFFGGIFVFFGGKKSGGIFVFFGGIFVFSGLVFNMIHFLAHSTVPYLTVPQRTVYRSEKKRTIKMDLVLKTQFSVYRSLQKMHFISFFKTEKLYEREP